MRLAIALEESDRTQVDRLKLLIKCESGEEKLSLGFRTQDLPAVEELSFNLNLASIACRMEVPSLRVNLEQYEARVVKTVEVTPAGQTQDLLRLSFLVVRELRAVRAGLRR